MTATGGWTLTKDDVHKVLTQGVMSQEDSEEDCLLFMALLHTHEIYLKPEVVVDDLQENDPNVPFPPATQRAAAAAVASVWPPGTRKGAPDYWYGVYSNETPYEFLKYVPPSHLERIEALKGRLLAHAFVDRIKVDPFSVG